MQGGSGGVIYISDSVVEGHLAPACRVGILSAACVSAGCASLLLLGGKDSVYLFISSFADSALSIILKFVLTILAG